MLVGIFVGKFVGSCVGNIEGTIEGTIVGSNVGINVGINVGSKLGDNRTQLSVNSSSLFKQFRSPSHSRQNSIHLPLLSHSK